MTRRPDQLQLFPDQRVECGARRNERDHYPCIEYRHRGVLHTSFTGVGQRTERWGKCPVDGTPLETVGSDDTYYCRTCGEGFKT